MTRREHGVGEASASRPAEWLIAVAGGLALAALLVWMVRGDQTTPDAPRATATVLDPVPPIAPASVLPATIPASAEAPAPDLATLKLRGIVDRPSGASAMVEVAGGRQTLVRVGSMIAPGIRVKAIAADQIALTNGNTTQILRFGEAPATPVQSAVTAAEASPATNPQVAALAATSSDWRIGLTAKRRDTRIIGFAVVDSARLLLLRRAGLQPGDIITAINGSALISEEKIIELPAEIAGAYAVELSYIRGDALRTVHIPINR